MILIRSTRNKKAEIGPVIKYPSIKVYETVNPFSVFLNCKK